MALNRNDAQDVDKRRDEMIAEIEQNTSDAVKRERAHARFSVRARVTAEPGSMSHRNGQAIDGVTGDVSAGGALILTSRPLFVNDVYLLCFDQAALPIPPVHALCLRVRMIRPDAFEVGLKFFSPIETPKLNDRGGNNTLI